MRLPDLMGWALRGPFGQHRAYLPTVHGPVDQRQSHWPPGSARAGARQTWQCRARTKARGRPRGSATPTVAARGSGRRMCGAIRSHPETGWVTDTRRLLTVAAEGPAIADVLRREGMGAPRRRRQRARITWREGRGPEGQKAMWRQVKSWASRTQQQRRPNWCVPSPLPKHRPKLAQSVPGFGQTVAENNLWPRLWRCVHDNELRESPE